MAVWSAFEQTFSVSVQWNRISVFWFRIFLVFLQSVVQKGFCYCFSFFLSNLCECPKPIALHFFINKNISMFSAHLNSFLFIRPLVKYVSGFVTEWKQFFVSRKIGKIRRDNFSISLYNQHSADENEQIHMACGHILQQTAHIFAF